MDTRPGLPASRQPSTIGCRHAGEFPLAREQRKLAAIVAADVVGYSRLMGRDESGTLARLKAHRSERLEPALARNGGRLVKSTGDGVLAEFGSDVTRSNTGCLSGWGWPLLSFVALTRPSSQGKKPNVRAPPI